MVKLYEESRVRKYIGAIVLATSISFLAATPYIIGKVSENYKTLENKVECTTNYLPK